MVTARTPILAVLACLACACSGCTRGEADGTVTFSRDVAPIVFEKCAVCHRPGEAAPFPLLAYDDYARRAKQVGIVTASGYMPPWLPAPGFNDLVGDRSLSEEQAETIRRWVEAGAPEGDPADLPALPSWPEGWQIGEPDLVVRMPQPYALQAEGRDVYRNFVIPAPVSEPRWIRAVEFRPDNRFVVHHALLFVDSSGGARRMEEEDPEPGYEGMGPGRGRIPDGQLIGWAPGKFPRAGSDDIAWLLDENTDIILQLHLRPTGRLEEVQVSLGLHFADAPPTRHPQSIRLVSRDIDIPPGEAEYVVEDRFRLPVDVEVLAVYPHAHYLGHDMKGFATLPDGSRRWLIRIPAWDFNWQDEYTYVEPVALPRGSVLTMRYTFDNSADNPLNPSSPPRRVVHGGQSTDEMAELILQVLPAEEDRPILLRDFLAKERAVDLAYAQKMARAEPDDPYWHALAASYSLSAGRVADAVRHYERTVELKPGEPVPLYNLGRALRAAGDPRAAAERFEQALRLDPQNLSARVELGLTQRDLGSLDEALATLRLVLEGDPANSRVHCCVGEILAARGEREAAVQHFEAAVAANPEHRRSLTNLGRMRLAQGRPDDALELANRAVALYPSEAWTFELRGLAQEARGELAAAEESFAAAARLEPNRPSHAENLRRARAARSAAQQD